MLKIAKGNLVILLSRFSLLSPQETLKLQNQLVAEIQLTQEDLATSILVISKATSLSRNDQLGHAIMELEDVLNQRKHRWGRKRIMGCATNLAGSISFQDEQDLEKPTELQEELLEMCKRTQHVELQALIISTIHVVALTSCLKEAVESLRNLARTLKARGRDEDCIRVHWHFIFLLAHQGHTFDREALFKESLTLCTETLEWVSISFGPESRLYLAYIDLLAKVYAIYTNWICHTRAIDHTHITLLERSIIAHRTNHSIRSAQTSENHRANVISLKRLATLLAQAGRTTGNQSYIQEAENHFRNLLEPRPGSNDEDSRLKLDVEVGLSRLLDEQERQSPFKYYTAEKTVYDYVAQSLHESHPSILFHANQLGFAYLIGGEVASQSSEEFLAWFQKMYEKHRRLRSEWHYQPNNHRDVFHALEL